MLRIATSRVVTNRMVKLGVDSGFYASRNWLDFPCEHEAMNTLYASAKPYKPISLLIERASPIPTSVAIKINLGEDSGSFFRRQIVNNKVLITIHGEPSLCQV